MRQQSMYQFVCEEGARAGKGADAGAGVRVKAVGGRT